MQSWLNKAKIVLGTCSQPAVAVAETMNEVLKLIQEAIQFHIEGLRDDGLPIPAPSSSVEFVEVRAA